MIWKLSYLGREITFFPDRQVQIVAGRLHPLTHEEWFRNMAEVKKLLQEQKKPFKLEQIFDADEEALLKPYLS